MVLMTGWMRILYSLLWVNDEALIELSLGLNDGIVNKVENNDVLVTVDASSNSVTIGSANILVSIELGVIQDNKPWADDRAVFELSLGFDYGIVDGV